MSNRVNLTLDVMKASIKNPLITIRQGEGDFETLRATVTTNGEPLDLQGFTITFMGTTAGKHKIVDDHVTIVDASKGIFDYTISKAWSMDVGGFKIAYFQFVSGDGITSSANFQVEVIKAVDMTQEESQHYISVIDATVEEINQRLNNSLASITQSIAANGSSIASSLAVDTSNVASSAVNEVNSVASNVSSVASSATSNVSSVASNAIDNVTLVASTAIDDVNAKADNVFANINSEANTYVKKSGDVMTGGLTGGQVELSAAGDLNELTATGKYVQTNKANVLNWDNRPSNAPKTAFSVDVIGSNDKSVVTQAYYANTTSRVWIRTLTSGTTDSTWTELANDNNVVHKVGNELVGGDKEFTGNVTADNLISHNIPVNLTKKTTFKSWFNSEVTACRNGNVVTIVNDKREGSLIYDTTHSQEAIPLGYRPSVTVLYPAINATSIKGQVQINTDGTLQAHGAIDGPYQLTATYITDDAWPI